ncbi:MAG: nickel pincer cofactor biosynthesis protein LarB [Thermodesulfobacteriota bacterium]|nr:nickel pincer cofactor biosynthesis protein LarB [Thermodesulfobacteriota bacterium]
MEIRQILTELLDNKIDALQAELMIKDHFWLGLCGEVARLDLGREKRLGLPEAVLCLGKEPALAAQIMLRLATEKGKALTTRVSPAHLEKIEEAVPEGYELHNFETAKMAVLQKKGFEAKKPTGGVGIISAGTADLPIAEEAYVTAVQMNCHAYKAYDVGVAGIHRLIEPLNRMLKDDKIDALVVVAGMDGVLPTLVKSLVDIPVIACPTSVGYGVSQGGRAALQTMLSSCSPGLSVVNIDNGFGAAAAAVLIARRATKYRESQNG